MTENRRSILGRIRDARATPTTRPEPAVAPDPVDEPEPPQRRHLYGSTYRVRVSIDEVLAARGYGPGGHRRSLVERPIDRHRRRAAAIAKPGEEALWPSQ